MLIIILFLLQELGVENPGPLSAVIILNDSTEVELTDLMLSGPDPFFLSLNLQKETEFLPLYRIVQIRSLPERMFWYKITLDNKEVIDAQIKNIVFSGKENEDSRRRRQIKLTDVNSIQIISGDQVKSCPNCEYEANTSYWFCPRCGADLQVGGIEENDAEAPTQPPLIRYRIDTRDQ